MGYRHLIEEETINYFGTKCKFVDVNGVRFYDSNKVEMMTEEEMEEKALKFFEEKLAEKDIFIEYMYAFAQGENANVVIRPNNITKCEQILSR